MEHFGKSRDFVNEQITKAIARRLDPWVRDPDGSVTRVRIGARGPGAKLLNLTVFEELARQEEEWRTKCKSRVTKLLEQLCDF